MCAVPTLFTDVFPIDLNADVILATVCIQTLGSLYSNTVLTMKRLSKLHRSFLLATLIQNHNQLGLLSVFIHTTEHGWIVNCLIAVHLCGSICFCCFFTHLNQVFPLICHPSVF